MFTDQSMPPDSIGWEWEQLDPAFQAGQIVICQNGSWMRGRADQADTGKSWKTAPFPYDKVPATYLEVKVEGVSKFAPHKAEAVDFLKWLYTRDNMVYVTQFDNLPSRSDSKDSQFWKNDPVWRGTFLDTVKDGHSMPSIPFGPALKLTMDEVQQVLYKKASPDQAAQDFWNGVKNYLDTSVNK
jgi:ABC-type glycerol-3-phosphate transport system substrate-binding protein